MSLIRARYRAVNTIMNLPRGGFVGLLDLYPNAAAAYSLRKLRAAYSGSAIRVRKEVSSVSSETDIGFLADGSLDTISLLTFASDADNGDASITTWYDQSGDGLDFVETTAANQGKIVSGGVLVTDDGVPAISLDGTDDNLSVTLPATAGTLLMGGKNTSAFYEFSHTGAYSLLPDATNTDFPLLVTNFIIFNSITPSDYANILSVLNSSENDFSTLASFSGYWRDRIEFTSFPLLDVSSGTSFIFTWRDCTSLTSFPLLDVSSGTNFSFAWSGCTSLTSFPLLDVSSGTNFRFAWSGCSSLTSFPLLDVSSGTNFNSAWNGCASLTSFPLLDVSSGTSFNSAWRSCISLTSFPANMFDSVATTDFTNAFLNTNLSSQSIENIVVSIDAAGQSNGTLDITGGGNATTATAKTAIDNLRGRGWNVTVPDGY